MEKKNITKKGWSLYFDLDENFYEIKFVKFLWQRKIARIICNSEVVGIIERVKKKSHIISRNCTYKLNPFKHEYIASKNNDKWNMSVGNNLISFQFINNKDFLIFLDDIKIGKAIYNLKWFDSTVEIELNRDFQKYYFQTIFLFSAMSGHRYIHTIEGNLFSSRL